MPSLSAADARGLAIHAQGLDRPRSRHRPATAVTALVESLGAVQLDTISVLARSHELVVEARLGATPRGVVEAGLWSRPAATVEYWAHAACLLPVAEWPWFAFRRRRNAARWATATAEQRAARGEVLGRLRDLGPLTTRELGGAKAGGEWWDWSPLKVAVERLLASGDVVCTRRVGWRRVYDLPDRALPAAVLGEGPTDGECVRRLVGIAATRLGVATVADLADYFRLPSSAVRAVLPDLGLEEVAVEGWRDPAYLAPSQGGTPPRQARPVLLSPFDSLVWFRPRTERLFAFRHRLEAYVPAALREHGYFTMPLLAGDRLRGRVDPRREGRTLVGRTVSVEPAAARAMARALWEAAAWVGADDVRVDEVRGVPAQRLREELGRRRP